MVSRPRIDRNRGVEVSAVESVTGMPATSTQMGRAGVEGKNRRAEQDASGMRQEDTES